MRLQSPVQFVQNDAGTHHTTPVFNVEFQDVIEILRIIQNQRFVDGLTALRSAAAPGENRNALFARNIDRCADVIFGFGAQNSQRHHLVEGGIGRIAAAGKPVEQDVALYAFGKDLSKIRQMIHLARNDGYEILIDIIMNSKCNLHNDKDDA